MDVISLVRHHGRVLFRVADLTKDFGQVDVLGEHEVCVELDDLVRFQVAENLVNERKLACRKLMPRVAEHLDAKLVDELDGIVVYQLRRYAENNVARVYVSPINQAVNTDDRILCVAVFVGGV